MRKLRIYLDTSVVGGCFDERFREASRSLMALFAKRDAVLLASDLLLRELDGAPVEVQAVMTGLPVESIERVALNEEADRLKELYLDAKVVGPTHGNDALHVGLATVARADMIVSWNFKHIVHF